MTRRTFCDRCDTWIIEAGRESYFGNPARGLITVSVQGLTDDADLRSAGIRTDLELCEDCGKFILEELLELTQADFESKNALQTAKKKERRCERCAETGKDGLSYRSKRGIKRICGVCLTTVAQRIVS